MFFSQSFHTVFTKFSQFFHDDFTEVFTVVFTHRQLNESEGAVSACSVFTGLGFGMSPRIHIWHQHQKTKKVIFFLTAVALQTCGADNGKHYHIILGIHGNLGIYDRQ